MKKGLLILLITSTFAEGRKENLRAPKQTPQEALAQYFTNTQDEETDLIFFAPDDGKTYKNILRGLIQETAVGGSIKVAAFRFTEKELAADLIEAHKRGVIVEVVFDPGAMTPTFYSVAFSLCDEGIPVYQYKPTGLIPASARSEELPQRISYASIMHHKTIIFTNTLNGKKIVAFGSLNFTTAGCYGNEEAVQIRSKKEIVEAFEEHFEKLKERSYLMASRATMANTRVLDMIRSFVRFIK